jgi:hypothetical protein
MGPEDIKEITKGIFNKIMNDLGIPREEVEKRYKARYEICLKCPTLSDDKTTCDKLKGGCGCPLSLRLRSNKGCPKGKWK